MGTARMCGFLSGFITVPAFVIIYASHGQTCICFVFLHADHWILADGTAAGAEQRGCEEEQAQEEGDDLTD